jgi:hypothetical protein
MKGHGNGRGRRWYIHRGCVLIAYVAVAKQRLLAKTVPTSGHRAGLANVAGFVTAFYVHGVLLVPGISTVLVPSAIFLVLSSGVLSSIYRTKYPVLSERAVQKIASSSGDDYQSIMGL